jgi:hypothetical protein
MRERAPKMFMQLRRSGQLEKHLQEKDKEANDGAVRSVVGIKGGVVSGELSPNFGDGLKDQAAWA